MPKHKHADLIIAWANGATIEFLNGDNWKYTEEPIWYVGAKYRIKPERVWPVTSLSEEECEAARFSENGLLVDVANAAIQRYIEDNEK